MVDVLEQERSSRAALLESLDTIAQVTPESLVRTDALGTALGFADGVDTFRRTLALFAGLRESSLDNVPINVLQQLKQSADQALQTFDQIKNFDPAGQSNPAAVRDGLINQVAEQYKQFFQNVASVVAYSVRKGTDFERLESEARTALEEINRVGSDMVRQREEILGETKATLEQVKRAAAQVGVAQHAVHFKEAAADHLRRSKRWLIATVALGAAPVGYGFWSLSYYVTKCVSLATPQSVQIGISQTHRVLDSVLRGNMDRARVPCAVAQLRGQQTPSERSKHL